MSTVLGKATLLFGILLSLAYCLWLQGWIQCVSPRTAICVSGRNVAPFFEREDITQTTLVFKVDDLIHSTISPFQQIEVYHHLYFGHMLVIDGALMVTDRDEFYYHEMMVHVPLAYLPDAKRVLVIGGGDGGTLKQVLFHPNIEECVLVDIDREVVEASKRYLSSGDAFSFNRTKLVFDNGADWVRRHNPDEMGHFDAIFVDSTDFGQAEVLFKPDFYERCKTLLKKGGVLTVNVDTPSWHTHTVTRASKRLSKVFSHAHLYHSQVPSYLSGHYSFMIASDDVHPTQTRIDWDVVIGKGIPYKYYTPDIHFASFALPAYLRDYLVPSVEPLRLSDVTSWHKP